MDRHLRDRFAVIKNHSPDPHIRNIASRVLGGEMTPRNALQDPEFGKFLAAGVAKGFQKLNSLGKEERDRLVQEGAREYEETDSDPDQSSEDDFSDQDSWLESFDDKR